MISPQRELTGKAIISWSRGEIRQARQTQLQPVLSQLGYRLLPRPDGNYAVAGMAHEIVIKQHYWNCPTTGQSGNAIDFFVKIRGVTFNEAMTLLSEHK